MTMQRLRTIFASFFKIGLFTFGGGYAMLPLIEQELIAKRGWIEHKEFLDLLTLAQSVPGPIAINSATYVGYTVGAQAGNAWCGILGAALATFAVCLPSLTLMLLITRFFLRLKQNPVVEGAMKGMRPVVIGMIASAALLLMFPHSKAPDEQNFIDGWSWALFGGVFVASVKKVNPILLICLSAAAGILIYYIF